MDKPTPPIHRNPHKQAQFPDALGRARMYASKLVAGAGVSGSSPLVGSPKSAVLQVKREVRRSGRVSLYRNRTATRRPKASSSPPTAELAGAAGEGLLVVDGDPAMRVHGDRPVSPEVTKRLVDPHPRAADQGRKVALGEGHGDEVPPSGKAPRTRGRGPKSARRPCRGRGGRRASASGCWPA
jgi:hypothetical protein